MPDLTQILTAAQMRDAEARLIAGGISVDELMDRAGTGAADWVYRLAAGRPVTILCGPGNNGGDGYVIARRLAERGLAVSVVAPIEPGTDAARKARAAWGGEVVDHARGEVFVDCLFGTGLTRALDDAMVARLGALAAAHKHAVAIDLPSGIDSDSGELLNEDLPTYDLTIALGSWKLAHWLMPAMELMGETRLVDIGVPDNVRPDSDRPDSDRAARLSTRPFLLEPDRDAHKYTRGLLAIVGGVMPGASVLSARAAMHGGAGYVKLLSEAQNLPVPPDLVVERDALSVLANDPRLDAVLIGPGLGRSEDARSQLAWTLACDVPTVCDADALALLEPDMLDGRTSALIVTPHAGELHSLSNSFGTVGLDRIEQVSELAEAIEGVVVAKGPDTIIAAPSRTPVILPPAPSWLSTAGTGDVLAGLIASQLATGAELAALLAEIGCWLHAEAARKAGPAFSASGLIDTIPEAYRAFL